MKRGRGGGGTCVIVVNLDVMMARRKIGLSELSARVGISPANLSILKNEKGRAIRLSTLNKLCRVLRCQPGDLLEYVEGSEPEDDE